MSKFFARFRRDEKGATAIEYGLIAALMAVVVIAAIGIVGPQLQTAFTNIGGQLASVPAAGG